MPLIKKVYAHCDVPCGIYETDSIKHAADTCKVMVQKAATAGDDMNNYVRYVNNKEIHADKCKNELQVLWSDYFKPEHLESFPDLHNQFWMAIKQCSKVKQSMDEAEADNLIERVSGIAQLFADSKK